MEKTKVAVIGCGTIAPMHLDAIKTMEELQLVAVCDTKKERAIHTANVYHTNAYTDYHEMFEQEQLDAVHLCLPHYLHTVVAEEAFRKGIHVLCEKPMSISYEDAVSAVNLAEECKVQYGVVFQGRYNTHAQGVKQRIMEGKLGTVRGANALLMWQRSEDYYTISDWKGTWEKEGGGVLINQAIHTLDLANWFVDDTPVKVQASMHNRMHPHIEVEDIAEGLITYQKGAIVSFYYTNNSLVDEPFEIRLLCEKGRVLISAEEAKIFYNDGTSETILNVPHKNASGTHGKAYWGTRHGDQIYQFYQAILGNEPLEVSGKEALKTQKLVCEIYKEAKRKFS